LINFRHSTILSGWILLIFFIDILTTKSYHLVFQEVRNHIGIRVEIIDLLGKMVSILDAEDKGRYDLKDLNTGIFMARLIDKKGQQVRQE